MWLNTALNNEFAMEWPCSFCGKEMSCPCPDGLLHKHADAASACPVCLELLDKGAKEGELKNHPDREDVEKLLEFEGQIEQMASEMSEQTFELAWRQDKELFKDFSKRELAEEMYFRGIRDALALLLPAADEKKLEKIYQEIEAQKVEESGVREN